MRKQSVRPGRSDCVNQYMHLHRMISFFVLCSKFYNIQQDCWSIEKSLSSCIDVQVDVFLHCLCVLGTLSLDEIQISLIEKEEIIFTSFWLKTFLNVQTMSLILTKIKRAHSKFILRAMLISFVVKLSVCFLRKRLIQITTSNLITVMAAGAICSVVFFFFFFFFFFCLFVFLCFTRHKMSRIKRHSVH